MDPNTSDQSEGVKWKDEQSNPTINMPPGMNGRTTSTKSLHVMPGDSMMWNNQAMWGGGMGGFGMQGQAPFHPMMGGWGPVPGMMGQIPMGPNSLRGSMHELNKNFLRPSSPSGSQKSSRSKNSNRSKKSNKSNTSTRRSKSNRNKERSRTNSSSQSRNASRSSKKQRDRSNSSDNDDSEDFFTGESDEEFVSISSNSDKAPRVSWTCEHCTYVNNPGVKVCAMCCKTSKNSREVGSGGQKNKDNDHKRDKNKTTGKGKKNYNSSDDDHSDNNRKSKSKSKKDLSSDGDSDNDRRRTRGRRGDSREKKKGGKSKSYKQSSRHDSDESDIDDDAVAAYYAVRIDKNKGMTVTQQNGSDLGRYDSSSESASAHNPMKRPNIDAPAPAKGILKKVASNPSLAKLDGMSEASGVISEVGYITNKLTQRLKARGQHDVLDSPDMKRRADTSSDDIWQHEKENWLRQKEELKAWAKAQGQSQGVEPVHQSPKVRQSCTCCAFLFQ